MNHFALNKLIVNKCYRVYCHFFNGFPDNRFVHVDTFYPNFDYNVYFLVNQLLHSRSDPKIYITYVENNIFLTNDMKNKLSQHYLLYKKIKRGLLTLLKYTRYKVFQKYNNKNILFDDFSKRSIKLIENRFIYTFDMFEIRNIAKSCFNYSENQIPMIKKMKNPYTNKLFAYHNVFNIYLFLQKHYALPILMHHIIKENMNTKICEGIMYDYHFVECLKSSYDNSNKKDKIRIIKKMLKTHNFQNLSNMDESSLLTFFSKYAKNFYIYFHLQKHDFCDDSVMFFYQTQYFPGLLSFYLKNRMYGRNILKRNMNGEYVISTINEINN